MTSTPKMILNTLTKKSLQTDNTRKNLKKALVKRSHHPRINHRATAAARSLQNTHLATRVQVTNNRSLMVTIVRSKSRSMKRRN